METTICIPFVAEPGTKSSSTWDLQPFHVQCAAAFGSPRSSTAGTSEFHRRPANISAVWPSLYNKPKRRTSNLEKCLNVGPRITKA